MQAASKNLRPVSLELGGKSPNIIFDDAKIDDAVNGSMYSGFILHKVKCVLRVSRLFVQESIYDEFMDEFR